MPFLSLSHPRNRATLIGVLLVIEFLAIFWLRESSPGQAHSHEEHSKQEHHDRQNSDHRQSDQGKKFKLAAAKMKASLPSLPKRGGGAGQYYVLDDQWDLAFGAINHPDNHRRSEKDAKLRKSTKSKSAKDDHHDPPKEKKNGPAGPVKDSISAQTPSPLSLPLPVDVSNPAPPVNQPQPPPKPEESQAGQEQKQRHHHHHHHHHRPKAPEVIPSIIGNDNRVDLENSSSKDKTVLEHESRQLNNDESVPGTPSKDLEGSTKSTVKDEIYTVKALPLPVAAISVTPPKQSTAGISSSTDNKKTKAHSNSAKLSKKQQQQKRQRQQQRQQRVEAKNEQGRFKSTKERKLAQLIPAVDEFGVVIEDHFISPRDSNGDGIPDFYVLLRPSTGSNDDIGLFDEPAPQRPFGAVPPSNPPSTAIPLPPAQALSTPAFVSPPPAPTPEVGPQPSVPISDPAQASSIPQQSLPSSTSPS
ncbi:hypothetical protein BGZ83_003792 [Gryganskiella cystojenkinii]|nr:hypothetical protein BGZ83_003792 [Gryganskiella cystojenkinii]